MGRAIADGAERDEARESRGGGTRAMRGSVGMKRVAPEPDVTPEEMLNAQRRLSDSRDELLQAG